MRLLIAFFVLLNIFYSSASPSQHLITFTNDGSFYRFDPITQTVDWVNSLNFQLLSLDISKQSLVDDNQTQTFLIPTIDGDFLYIDERLRQKGMKEIVVARQDIQQLLDICFENKEYQSYFVYQKLEYLVLNLQNGQFTYLEEFFKSNKVLNRKQHNIMIISKKLLKQMNNQMKVKWSIISSTVSLINPDEFVKDPKSLQLPEKSGDFKFFRRGPRVIQIEDIQKQHTFEIQSQSPILSIFLVSPENKVSKVQIIPSQRKILALEAKPIHENIKSVGQIDTFQNSPNFSFQSFPHSADYENNFHSGDSDLAFCINSFKIMKQMNGNRAPQFIGNPKIFQDEEGLPPTIPFSYDKQSHVYIPKEQPIAQIFLVIILITMVIFVYFGVKTDKMKKLISDLNQQNDEKINEIKKKLGEYENAGKQLKKMYQVNWQKIILDHGNYCVFEGRFLNQLANVYALPVNGNDIIFIEHQLNLLINCSHRNISKLYYYTRNDDYLLIFAQTNPTTNTLTNITEVQKLEFDKKDEMYRSLIKDIIEPLVYLIKNKIQFNSLVSDSIQLSSNGLYKLNIIPSFLQKNDEKIQKRLEELGTNYIRFNLVQIIHFIGYKCQQFDIQQFEKQKNTDEEQNFFLKDFYDFILTGHNPKQKKDESEEDNSMVQIISHPYLWDSKQKMLFIIEFSNYLETNLDQTRVHKLEVHCKNHSIIKTPWNKELHYLLIKQINNFRKYDYHSVRDLIRLIRNKVSHYHQLPKDTKAAIGKNPEQFVEYFLTKFPKLLAFMHIYVQKKKWKLHIQ